MPSLLTALLELQPPKVGKGSQQGYINRLTQYRKMDEQEKKKVHKQLYEALYAIIEYSTMPQNRDLNMAIGKALAKAINDDGKVLTQKERSNIKKLGDTLRQVVDEAVGEIQASGDNTSSVID